MKNYNYILAVAFMCVALLFQGCGMKKHYKEKALALDVQHFKDTMKITDDEMETHATFSTVDGYDKGENAMGVLVTGLGGVWTEEFLRGVVDKKTGEKKVVCYVIYRHQDDHWAYPYQANYGKPLRTVKVKKVSSDVDCHKRLNTDSCTYFEHVAFSIDKKELERVKRVATPKVMKERVRLPPFLNHESTIFKWNQLPFLMTAKSIISHYFL